MPEARISIDQLLQRYTGANYRKNEHGEVTQLDLGDTEVRNDELRCLSDLGALEILWLDRCPHITDASLGYVSSLAKLEILSLMSTQITDVGVQRLRGLAVLRVLDLRSTSVTATGLQRLSCLVG